MRSSLITLLLLACAISPAWTQFVLPGNVTSNYFTYVSCFSSTTASSFYKHLSPSLGPAATLDSFVPFDGSKYISEVMTIDTCARLAVGYRYFGLTYGSICLVTNQTLRNSDPSLQSSNCNSPCSANTGECSIGFTYGNDGPAQNCADALPLRNSVFAATSLLSSQSQSSSVMPSNVVNSYFAYQGLVPSIGFSEARSTFPYIYSTSSSGFVTNDGSSFNSYQNMTVDLCAYLAWLSDYPHFGLVLGTGCLATSFSYESPSHFTAALGNLTTYVAQPCPGNPAQICGAVGLQLISYYTSPTRHQFLPVITPLHNREVLPTPVQTPACVFPDARSEGVAAIYSLQAAPLSSTTSGQPIQDWPHAITFAGGLIYYSTTLVCTAIRHDPPSPASSVAGELSTHSAAIIALSVVVALLAAGIIALSYFVRKNLGEKATPPPPAAAPTATAGVYSPVPVVEVAANPLSNL
ncbi:unnamed protein product [Sphagnum tenellum]